MRSKKRGRIHNSVLFYFIAKAKFIITGIVALWIETQITDSKFQVIFLAMDLDYCALTIIQTPP